ncbi:Formate efflux transporter [Methylophaga thiooxydans]|uniref:Formate/nitrite transporter superfamily n=2 Tax=Methylophaga thiooxydans TaxID=392484 RepID=C0N8Q8_9GAMM|nr:formate/nitrite transporter family protein [Methylophaga thiooxydans]EEF78792.1 Formate/nitrite transporter superfamily [Methylophaga thiooxydans DMS010]KGM08157.1 Formate efflux transporter [Methylophaga thiooxydans]
MSDFGKFVDAFTPAEVAEKVKTIGVDKANMHFLSLIILALMAGAFIAFGAMYYTVAITDSTMAYGMTKLVGGVAFSLGFIMVVIAGAELFTGNTLVVMAWAKGKVSLPALLKTWTIVYIANALGAFVMVYLVYLSGYLDAHHHQVGATALKAGLAKVDNTLTESFVLGLFCNVLVCLASWMVYASRTVSDKVLAILFPISAFVAMGFEHCIANMYMIPVAILASLDPAIVAASGVDASQLQDLSLNGFMMNIIPVTLGNIIGGGVFVAMTYYLVFVYSPNSSK